MGSVDGKPLRYLPEPAEPSDPINLNNDTDRQILLADRVSVEATRCTADLLHKHRRGPIAILADIRNVLRGVRGYLRIGLYDVDDYDIIHRSSYTDPTQRLGIGGIYSTGWIDLKGFSGWRITVNPTVASATGGFVVQYSHDMNHVVETEDNYTIGAGATKTFTFSPAARYGRIVYTNGAVAQGDWVLLSRLTRHPQKWSSHKVSEAFGDDTDGEMVVAVMKARNPTTGNYDSITLATNGGLPTKESPPLSTDILSGSRTTTGTIITVPAGKIWRGTIAVDGCLAVAAGGGTVNANVRVDWTPGTGGTAAYTPARIEIAAVASGGLGGVGSEANDAKAVPDVILYAGTTDGTLVLNQANATNFHAACSGAIVN